MKSFVQYTSLPKNVLKGRNPGQAQEYSGLRGAIATIQQKLAKQEQSLFPVNSYDAKEFGGLLGSGDTLCRMSTPMTSNSNDAYRTICIVNVSKGNVRFLDSDKYEQGIMKLERALKFKWLNIDPDKLVYFSI